MLRDGRPEDQQFSPSELMYRRYVQEDFDGEALKPARFSVPPSLNRGKLSEPEDVIFSETGEFDEYGVLECIVEKLSVTVVDDRRMEYVFVPVHLPEENNYSHSEMWADCTQTGQRTDRISKVARKEYRTMVCQRFKVRIASKK
jgi:hypothetical protein